MGTVAMLLMVGATLAAALPFSSAFLIGRQHLHWGADRAVGVPVTMSAVSEATPATTSTRKPRAGEIVTIDLNLTPDGSFVPEPLFDSSGRVSFVLGGGNFVPGLHDLVGTMVPGETAEDVRLDAGWGERREELVAKVSKERGEDDGSLDYDKIEVGTELRLSNGAKCVVTEVTDTDFTIDANPPLAGTSYTAEVVLIGVEEGPSVFEFSDDTELNDIFEVATVALGCFWGGELAYMRAPGVVGTKVGYTQGELDNPTYEQVCSATTGHTEAIQIIFNSSVVSYEELIKLGMDRLGESKFLLNQVGNDQGTQYRHGIYYHSPKQEEVARRVLGLFGERCKTETLPANIFYDAEDEHQQYLLKGGQSARKGEDAVIRCYG